MKCMPFPSRFSRVSIGVAMLALAGVLASLMLFEASWREIVRDIANVGWGTLAIIAFHIPLIACTALAWRTTLGERWTGRFWLLVWARWVREATNMLLPVGQVGGEVIGARLLALRGTKLSRAAASVILDKTNEALAQVAFTLLGLFLLVLLGGAHHAILWVELALPLAGLMVIGLLVIQQGGLFKLLERSLIALGKRLEISGLAEIAGLERTLRALFRPKRVTKGMSLHLIAWVAGAGEVWLALYFMGAAIDFPRALVIESLSALVRSIGFVIPGALGVQEGGYIAIGTALGISPEQALAASLVKRICQITLALPGVLTWQISEARRLPRERDEVTASATALGSGSVSSAGGFGIKPQGPYG